jgi:hypothetical protein
MAPVLNGVPEWDLANDRNRSRYLSFYLPEGDIQHSSHASSLLHDKFAKKLELFQFS